MNGQFHYASIDDILKDNGVTSFKETGDGLVAIHKRHPKGYYWKYYRWHSHHEPGFEDGYYYTGSTSKLER